MVYWDHFVVWRFYYYIEIFTSHSLQRRNIIRQIRRFLAERSHWWCRLGYEDENDYDDDHEDDHHYSIPHSTLPFRNGKNFSKTISTDFAIFIVLFGNRRISIRCFRIYQLLLLLDSLFWLLVWISGNFGLDELCSL